MLICKLAGTAVGAGLGAAGKGLDREQYSSVSSKILSQLSSASSVKSMESVAHASTVAYIKSQVDVARASAEKNTGVYDSAKDPFTFTKRAVSSGTALTTHSVAPSVTAPPPGAKSLGPAPIEANQRPLGYPEGVNLYNLQLCQYAIVHMNVTGKYLLFDNPGTKSKLFSR